MANQFRSNRPNKPDDFTRAPFHDYRGYTPSLGIDLRQAAGIPVYHADQLEQFLEEHPVSVGVLTVSKAAAAPMAERLAKAGVRGIWNFTNTELPIHDPDVVVENVHFADSLLALSYMISEE